MYRRTCREKLRIFAATDRQLAFHATSKALTDASSSKPLAAHSYLLVVILEKLLDVSLKNDPHQLSVIFFVLLVLKFIAIRRLPSRCERRGLGAPKG